MDGNFVYIRTSPGRQADGRFLVARTQYNKKAFRDFCRVHGHIVRPY